MPKSSSLRASPKSATYGPPAVSIKILRGLDVTVDNAPRVSVVQGLGDGRRPARPTRRRRADLLSSTLGQVVALDKLRDDEATAVLGAPDVVDRHDVGVIEARDDACLFQVGLDIPRLELAAPGAEP